MTRAVVLSLILCILATSFVACGGYSNPQSGGTTSQLTTRALVSNLTLPGVTILDYSKDRFSTRHPAIGLSNPAFMVLSADKKVTLTFGLLDNTLTAIDNVTEAASTSATLPGATNGFAISADDATAYAAIPTGPVFGQAPGLIQVITLGTGFAPSLRTTIPIPGVAFLAASPNGNRIVAMSAVSNTVYVVNTSLIGTGDPNLVKTVTNLAFDHPVSALVSSDNNTAYVLSCGLECGGAQASVAKIDLTTDPPSVVGAAAVPAATVGLISGSTMYVAGSHPSTPCTGQTTAAAACGQLTVVDLTTMTSGNTALVTDGYHDRIALAGNKEIFLGAEACSQVNTSTEQRGCLSIVDSSNLAAVIFPPDQGDVTGIAAIPNRHVVYVTQGGELRIYDTNTNAVQATQLDIVGQATDVKVID